MIVALIVGMMLGVVFLCAGFAYWMLSENREICDRVESQEKMKPVIK